LVENDKNEGNVKDVIAINWFNIKHGIRRHTYIGYLYNHRKQILYIKKLKTFTK
jgi:hypothetical protein